MGSFWGTPTSPPRGKDVAKFLEIIRKLTEKQPDRHALRIATAALVAIVAFIHDRFGPKEALALLDTEREKILETI